MLREKGTLTIPLPPQPPQEGDTILPEALPPATETPTEAVPPAEVAPSNPTLPVQEDKSEPVGP